MTSKPQALIRHCPMCKSRAVSIAGASIGDTRACGNCLANSVINRCSSCADLWAVSETWVDWTCSCGESQLNRRPSTVNDIAFRAFAWVSMPSFVLIWVTDEMNNDWYRMSEASYAYLGRGLGYIFYAAVNGAIAAAVAAGIARIAGSKFDSERQ